MIRLREIFAAGLLGGMIGSTAIRQNMEGSILKHRTRKEKPTKYEAGEAGYLAGPETNISQLPEEHNLGIVIVDIENTFLPNINQEERNQLVENIGNVLETAAEIDIPVMVQYKYTEETDPYLEDILDTVPQVEREYARFVASSSAGRFGPSINLRHIPDYTMFEVNDVDALYVVGIYTDNCVKRAAEFDMFEGYTVITTTDVVASRDPCLYNDCTNARSAFNWFIENAFLGDDYTVVVEYMERNEF
jgi:nicotinamidase-related amidase